MTIQVPSAFTVVGSQITTDSTRWTYGTVTREADQYTYYDFGASYFSGSAYYESTVYVSATAGTGNKTLNTIFSNLLNDWSAFSGGTQYECGGEIFGNSSNANAFYGYVYNFNNNASTTVTFNTVYYTRAGFFSALGQYGAVVSQLFSDSSRTTLVGFHIINRTANTSYRYLLVGQNYVVPNTNSITGYEESLTLFQPAAGIDLTTATGGFVQTDPSAHIADYADCLVATTLNTNEDAYHYKDYGASYFNGNYILTGALNVTAFATGSGTMFTLLSLMNTINDGNNTDDKQCVAVDYVSASTYTIKLREVSSATGYNSSSSSTLNTNQPYWLKEWRDTSVGTYGTLYLSIYNDPTMLSLVETLSLTLHDNGTPDVAAFQYFYPLQSWNTASSRTSTFTFGGVAAVKVEGGVASGDGVATSSIVGASLIAASSLSGDGVATGLAVGASVAEAVTSGVGVATGAAVGELFSAGSAAASGTGVGTGLAVGASTWAASASGNGVATASGIGSGTIPISYTAYIMCRITKQSETTGIDEPATGLTPTVNFFRTTDLYSLDFSDSTFKADASCISISANMTAKNATYYPGWYVYQLSTYGLGSGAKTTYVYSINASISSSQAYYNEGSMIFLDGIEVLPGLTVAENTLVTRVSATLTNKHVLNPVDGTIKVYDDSGTLLYSGLAYTDAAGTVLYDGTAAVHHTTRLT